MAVIRERIALPEGCAILGTLAVEEDTEAPRVFIAVSSRPCCLAAISITGDIGRGLARRWFFAAQPISVSQNRALAHRGEFVVLLDDGGVWRCSFAVKRVVHPSKKSKTVKATSSVLSFVIHSDARSIFFFATLFWTCTVHSCSSLTECCTGRQQPERRITEQLTKLPMYTPAPRSSMLRRTVLLSSPWTT